MKIRSGKVRFVPAWPWELYAMLGVGLGVGGGVMSFAVREFTSTMHAEKVVRDSLNVKLRGRCTFVSLRRSGTGYEGVVGNINGSTYPISASIDAFGQAHYRCALVNN